MAETQPMNLQALCYTAAEDRQALNALVNTEGVVNEAAGGLLVTSTTPATDHSVTVAAGQAYVLGDTDAPAQGMYRVRNDAAEVVQLPVGSGGALNRIDTIIARVRDGEYSGLDNDWVIEVVAGIPATSATTGTTGADFTATVIGTAGALPATALVLGYVRVMAADTLTTAIAANNVFDARTPYLPADIARWHLVGGVGEPAFTSGWSNVGGATAAASYRKERDRVYLRGVISGGSLSGSVFTLPVGFRPPVAIVFPCVSNSAFGVFQINADGTLAPTVGSTTAVNMTGISFSVTP